jgi:hypothetical protein
MYLRIAALLDPFGSLRLITVDLTIAWYVGCEAVFLAVVACLVDFAAPAFFFGEAVDFFGVGAGAEAV